MGELKILDNGEDRAARQEEKMKTTEKMYLNSEEGGHAEG